MCSHRPFFSLEKMFFFFSLHITLIKFECSNTPNYPLEGGAVSSTFTEAILSQYRLTACRERTLCMWVDSWSLRCKACFFTHKPSQTSACWKMEKLLQKVLERNQLDTSLCSSVFDYGLCQAQICHLAPAIASDVSVFFLSQVVLTSMELLKNMAVAGGASSLQSVELQMSLEEMMEMYWCTLLFPSTKSFHKIFLRGTKRWWGGLGIFLFRHWYNWCMYFWGLGPYF